MIPAQEVHLSVHQFVEGGYMIDSTPAARPDGKFAAHAVVTCQADGQVIELWPEFDPFITETEASSAAHMAAVAWIGHRS